MKALLAALAMLAVPPSVHPWPIGPGPRFLPPARSAAVAAGKPVGSLACGASSASFRLHLEVFVNRKVVVVPAGIGVSKPGCVYAIRTTAPGGVFYVARGAGLTLADLFHVWGQPLGANRLVSFSSGQPVRAYVAGKPVSGPIGAIPLTRHAEIVVELGAYVAPHPFFLFPGGDS
jgi:hypothetical protein